MSNTRITDLMLLLAGSFAAAGCPASTVSDDDGGISPSQTDALNAALAACKLYAHKTADCFEEAYGEVYGYNYLSQLGYCVVQFGYADALGDGCGDAHGDYFACLSAQDCQSFLGGDTPVDDGGATDDSSPCRAEQDAVDRACGDDDGIGSPGPPED